MRPTADRYLAFGKSPVFSDHQGHLEETMRLVIAFLFVFVAIPVKAVKAQINPQNTPMNLVSGCLNSAINQGSIEKRGEAIRFVCRDQSAVNLYNYLGSGGFSQTSNVSGTVKARNRFVDPSYSDQFCQNVYEDAYGRSINRFLCVFEISVGPLLNR